MITVEDTTYDVAGVATTPVSRTEPTGDQVVDYYAQDRRGNVWWFGREGVWLAGEDGAEAGLAMPATPRVGDGWRAAYDADVVDVRTDRRDRDQVVTTPAGTLRRRARPRRHRARSSPARATRAFYARGVGLVEEVSTERHRSYLAELESPPADATEAAHSGGRSWVVSVPGSGCVGGGCCGRARRVGSAAWAAWRGAGWAGVGAAAGPVGPAATAPAASTPVRRGPTASRPG